LAVNDGFRPAGLASDGSTCQFPPRLKPMEGSAMTRPVLSALLACLALAACGVDGEPQPPAKTGVTITGEAKIGVVSQ
jgi:hypothetical protein